ncbi:MAG TPA: hypothetical protein VIJ67_12950 [Pseudolabrys sp.]|jgi:hypothetical protein
MRKLVTAVMALNVVALTIVVLPVHAQGRGGDKAPTAEEIEKKRDAADLDQKYKAALKQTQSDAQTTAKKDPWANMRGPAAGK